MMFGDKVEVYDGRMPDVVGRVERAPAGNVILVTGRSLLDGGWEKMGHIVLLPDEARALADRLLEEARFDVEAVREASEADLALRKAHMEREGF